MERWERRNKTIIHNLKENIKSIESEIDRFEVVSNIDNYIDLMKRDLKNEFKVRRFEDKRRVIEKYVEKIEVKLLGGDNFEKEYEIRIKLFYDGGDDGNGMFKVLYNTLTNSIYKSFSHLAERKGFEPSIRFWRIHTFQACAFDHSATSLKSFI